MTPPTKGRGHLYKGKLKGHFHENGKPLLEFALVIS